MFQWLLDTLLYLVRLGFTHRDGSVPMPATITTGEIKDLSKEITRPYDICAHSGEFTDIWIVRWNCQRSGSKMFAAKVIREVVNDIARREKVSKSIMDVYGLWHQISKDPHENIVPFYGFANGFGSFPSAIIPYYENGDALSYVLKHQNVDKHSLVKDIAAGLAYLHSLPEKVSHGNLKASNVLIDDEQRARITDIRLYLVVANSDFTTAYVAGSCRWQPPEVMDPPESSESDMTDNLCATSPEADVYSYGMTMLEIYSEKRPFAHKRNDATVVLDVMKGLRPFRPECLELTDNLWDIMQQCWKTEPTARPTMAEVLTRLDSVR